MITLKRIKSKSLLNNASEDYEQEHTLKRLKGLKEKAYFITLKEIKRKCPLFED